MAAAGGSWKRVSVKNKRGKKTEYHIFVKKGSSVQKAKNRYVKEGRI
jgi:hypothetical protein